MTDSTPTPITATRHTVVVPNSIDMVTLFGPGDEHLGIIEKRLGIEVHVRGNRVTLAGEPHELGLAEKLIEELVAILRTGQGITPDVVERVEAMLRAQTATSERPADVLSLNILSNRGRSIRPKTLNQKRYVETIDNNTITFGIGPAGTGKTYLAMAKAVQALQAKQVNRIILTRPAVEAGERLGYLPGTLSEKIDPYLRPLYDALHDMLDPESIPKLMAAGTIEVAPLAYMRGRAQPVDTPVLTPTGWAPIGSLEVGDLVVGSNGLPTPVLGVFPQGQKDVYRVRTQDGASTRACGEHLWTVTTPEDRRRYTSRTLETQEMIGHLRRGHIHRYELPLTGAVEFEPQDVPMDPYALGLLLGDGCITTASTPCFTTKDSELAERMAEAVGPLGIELYRKDEMNYVLRNPAGGRGGLRVENPATRVIRSLGLAGAKSETKFVPDLYKFNSAWVRLWLLQGLLDTDGGPVTQTGRTCRVQYSTISPRLRDDVIFLVRSLGGTATWRDDSSTLDIRLPDGLSPFRLARKKAKYDATGGGRPMRFITAIEPDGQAECVCIQVAAEDSLYVTDDFIVTHNTLNDSFIILDEAQNTTPEQMKMFLTRLGFGSKIVVTGDVTQVDLPTGTNSGLRIVEGILDGVEDLAFVRLTSHDVVRHKLVARIVAAYEEFDTAHPASQPQREIRQNQRFDSRSDNKPDSKKDATE